MRYWTIKVNIPNDIAEDIIAKFNNNIYNNVNISVLSEGAYID